MKQHRKRIRSMALVAAFCLLFSSLGFLPSSADRGYPTPSSVVINGKTVPLQIDKYRPGHVIGIAYEFQILPSIPHDVYDKKADYIVSEVKIYGK